MDPKYLGAAFAAAFISVCTLQGQTLYNFGNPTADEQQYIEFINRSRANPPAEGARLAATTDPDVVFSYTFFGVDKAMLQSEFNLIPARQPLAPNVSLTTAARGHSAWMLANDQQTHNEGAVTPMQRMVSAGYTGSGFAENAYAASKSSWFGHAGLNVDWGSPGSGGMQTGRGHRANIHEPLLNEIGVGIVYGSKTVVGPQVVTQDFGKSSGAVAFATGVAYYDLNGNNFYDAGEGISDLTVNVQGASYYAKTAIGGGWSVPVPSSAANRTVTFSGPSLNQSTPLAISAGANAKLDLKLSYAPPTLTSSLTAFAGVPYQINLSGVPGAASFKWKRWTTAAAPAENAEDTTKISTFTLGGYAVRSTSIKHQGTSSFHLVNGTVPGTQWIELTPLFLGQASPSINFRSRLRTASTAEQYKMQVKDESGGQWTDVYSQPGTNTAGEASFSLRTVPLASMANKLFRVRFLLQHTGAYYGNNGDAYGWFIDAINFTNIQGLQNETVSPLSGTSGSFTPAAAGSFLQAAYPVISGIDFPPSFKALTVQAALPAGFANWVTMQEASNALPAGSLANPEADYDKDGQPNLVEYAFGTSPALAAESRPRYPQASQNGSNIIVNYQIDTSLSDLSYVAEASTTLAADSWRTPGQGGAPAGFMDQLVSTNGSIQSRKATIPLSAGAKVLFRVRVVKSP